MIITLNYANNNNGVQILYKQSHTHHTYGLGKQNVSLQIHLVDHCHTRATQ